MASSSTKSALAKLSARTIPMNTWFKLKFEASSADPLCPHIFRADNYIVVTSNDIVYVISSPQNCCNKAQPFDLYLFSARDSTVTAFETSGEKPTFHNVTAGSTFNDGTSLIVIDGENHAFSLDLENKWWTRIRVHGPIPGQRGRLSVTIVGSKFFLFGGYVSKPTPGSTNEVWVLDLSPSISKPSWAPVKPSTSEIPDPRCGHICVRYGDGFVIFGGYDLERRGYYNDTWSFNVETRAWSKLQCMGSIPTARHLHAGALMGSILYISGGHDGWGLSDIWALDLSERQWHALILGRNSGAPNRHSMVAISRKIYVFGGTVNRSEVDILDIDLILHPTLPMHHQTKQQQAIGKESTSQPGHDDSSPPPYDEGSSSSQAGHDSLPSLLALLKNNKSGAPIGSVINPMTLNLMRKLLGMSNYLSISSQLDLSSDIEIILDFLLQLLDNNAIPGTSNRARRLMLKIVDVHAVLPDSLLLSGIKVGGYRKILLGELGDTQGGELQGKKVTLKSLRLPHSKNFPRDILTWRSLRHQNVLPILGLHEIKAQRRLRYLVIPEMEHGTLSQWRKERSPTPAEIQKLILQVAEGLQYIHSEGIIHGDLRGSNILLDSDLNAKVANFGMARASETTSEESQILSPNFAAPELFGELDDDDNLSDVDVDEEFTGRTEKSDVYAFGCLYYEIHFNTVPFDGVPYDNLVTRVTKLKDRPKRLEMPALSDGCWRLMRRCWRSDPRRRPTMEAAVHLIVG